MGWLVENSRVTLKSDGYECVFDQTQPYLGLEFRSVDRAIAMNPLFATNVAEASETYVRGCDLVNRYVPRSSDLVSYQTYHRYLPDEPGIDFILSAQTNLLDSNPLTQVTSSTSDTELVLGRAAECSPVTHDTDFSRGDVDFFLLRPASTDAVSFLLSVHRSDFHRATVRVSSQPSVAFWVFPAPLEKGVIRRAAFQFRVIPRADDESIARNVWSEVVRAAPVLAT